MSSSFKLFAIVTLLAFLAIIIYLLVNHIVYILTITHNVQIEISRAGLGFDNIMTFKVINNGIMPVTNLTLKIVTKYEIINHTKEFSTVPVDSWEIKPKFIEACAPKLVHGSGSSILITVHVNNTKPTGYNKYSAYAVYDQGSNKADFAPIIHNIEKVLATSDKSIKISLLVIGVAILGAGLLLTLIKFFNYLKTFLKLRRKRERKVE